MTDPFIARLHDHPARGVFYVTGGGTLLLSDLLTVPGASGTVLEAQVPYSEAALGEILGAPAEQASSAPTARALAMQAYLRAHQLGGQHDSLFGFAITAALTTGRTKRGPHRAHLAMQTASDTHSWSLQLDKGLRSRSEEERLVADIGLAQLAHAFQLERLGPDLTDQDSLEIDSTKGNESLQALLHGQRPTVGRGQPDVIFPGSFNPLHHGHRGIAAHAAARLGKEVTFELCIRNVDKPPLNYHDVHLRLAQFDGAEQVWLTNTPTFVEKARAIGGVTFVVGVDTVLRIGETKYYDSVAARDASLAELASIGCRFLVFGRVDGASFKTLDDLDLPETLATLCDGVTEAEYRQDLSSSELRATSVLADQG